MALEPGQTLLHYHLIDKIGEGGMGVVWRATDTTLDREVAIKILPEGLAQDPERLARFEREAKLLASLNHPSIAGVYGLHEAGGMRFLAMEFVPGEDLAVRLQRGPLAMDDALEVAEEICEALAAAHDAGVVHRDLKPANVMRTPDGKIKVLDFGLAKALSADPASGSDVSVSVSPTMTSAGTQVGMILGTAAYMSPEQAKGKAVDRRTDVWSFGCVLYECLTGRRAFAGETVSEILAEVLKGEPDWTALPPSTSPSVRRVLRRSLVKSPRDRLRDLGDARLELADSGSDDVAGVTESTPASRSSKAFALTGWIVAAPLLVVLIATLATRGRETPPPTAGAPSLHAEIGLPDDAPLGFGTASLGVDSNLLALSPDGTLLVYVGGSAATGSRLYRQDLTGFDPPEAIPGTEGAHHAFFSPDGSSIGFLAFDKLKRVAPNGDDLRTIAPVSTAIRGQWTRDDTIYVGAVQGRRIQRVPAGGGALEDVYILAKMVFLEVLPHGRSALVMLREGISTDYADIALLDLETFETTTILEGGYDARLVGSDRIVFARGGDLLAAPFDLEQGTITGDPVTIMRGVVMDTAIGQAQFTWSESGTMVFARGPELSRGGVARIDRDGDVEFLAVPIDTYGAFDLDPTDTRLAIHVADLESYVWMYDIENERGTRLPGRNTGWPVWSRDGARVGYNDGADRSLRVETVEGGAAARPEIPNELAARIADWSLDDRVLSISRQHEGINQIGFLDLEDGTVDWLDNSGSSQWGGVFSPDGTFVAYSTNETGAWEVWVRSYPDGSMVRQISDGGGMETVWSPTGELFYRRGDRWMVTQVTTEPALRWTTPRQVFQTDFIDTLGRSYDVSSDGRHLYVVKQPEPPDGSRVHVVTGWAP